MLEATGYDYQDLISMDFEKFFRALGRATQRQEAKQEQAKQQQRQRKK